MGLIPGKKIAIRLGVPKTILGQTKQQSIGNHSPVMVAGKLVTAPPGFDLGNISWKNPVEEDFRIFSTDLKGVLPGMAKNELPSDFPVHLIRRSEIQCFRSQSPCIEGVFGIIGKFLVTQGMNPHRPGQFHRSSTLMLQRLYRKPDFFQCRMQTSILNHDQIIQWMMFP